MARSQSDTDHSTGAERPLTNLPAGWEYDRDASVEATDGAYATAIFVYRFEDESATYRVRLSVYRNANEYGVKRIPAAGEALDADTPGEATASFTDIGGFESGARLAHAMMTTVADARQEGDR